MITFVKSFKLLVLFTNACLFIFTKADRVHLSNYTNAKVSCHNRGGLITQKLLKFGGLINITCELSVGNGVLKDGESVWIQGRAQTGPYIALYTCIRFSSQDKYSFAKSRTFQSNILYECSIFCDNILHSTGYLGIYKDSCLCLYDTYRMPRTPECLDNDFLDRHKGILVFKLINRYFDIQSKSSHLNCMWALFQEDGKASYFNTKCASSLYSICSPRVNSDLSNECLPRLWELCFNEEYITFLEHYRKCWVYNGTLIPFLFRENTFRNISVMLGSFRAFKAEDDGQNNDIATLPCLSITKYNGIIYLETENCSNANAFICMNDIFNTSRSETNDGASETNDGANTNIRQLFIIICSILVSVIIMLTLLVVWLLCRLHSHKRPRYNNRLSQNDMYITPTPEDRLENDATQVAESAAYGEVE